MVPAPAQGIITHAGLGSIRALDDKTETARQVNELLDDENRHRTVGRTAQERVRARDNWGRPVNEMQPSYEELAG